MNICYAKRSPKMETFINLYQKKIVDGDKNLHFWEKYIQNLKDLDFNTFAKKLKIPVLVPIGSRIQFRGELKHTNEFMVTLGAGWYVKCSLEQADILRQHRIEVAQKKLDACLRERDFLTNQVLFNKEHLSAVSGEEIVETHSEAEDKAWRTEHRENVRKYIQGKAKAKTQATEDITDEQLWNRLDELEIQEDLEEEYLSMKGEAQSRDLQNSDGDEGDSDNSVIIKEDEELTEKDKEGDFIETSKPNSELHLLQQVINKQNELEAKLLEMQSKESLPSKNEEDLISKLDQMEKLDELEDEMDRLDDILLTKDMVEPQQEEPSKPEDPKRSVSFADEDNSETLEITFEHSNINPNTDPYNPDKGILKPSDIYEAYPNLFDSGTTSILKKSKHVKKVSRRFLSRNITKCPDKSSEDDETGSKSNKAQFQDEENRTILVKDIVERGDTRANKVYTNRRPVSLYKKKRLQNKI